MIVWVGECGKYDWSRKIYWFLNTEQLKTNKGFQEPSYFLFSPFCAKLFWQACLQVSQNIHKFRFYLGINPQRGSIKINWNAKAQLQLLQEIRSKLAVNLKCQCSAYLTFKCWNQCVLVLNTWKLWCIDWKLFTWLPFNRAVLAQNLFLLCLKATHEGGVEPQQKCSSVIKLDMKSWGPHTNRPQSQAAAASKCIHCLFCFCFQFTFHNASLPPVYSY